jgi:hypothetical protein
MGFLDNSGDIILDAVLTDLGRKRLAEGNFTISQFAVADDEINYTLYNPSHPSGSSYYDLEIIQTPILESFTNNTSTMKSRLLTITDSGLLYLPVIKENTNTSKDFAKHSSNTFLVAVDQKTEKTGDFDNKANGIGKEITTGAVRTGVLYGFSPSETGAAISLHQGIDNVNKPKKVELSSTLTEEQYIIQIDGRFGTIVGKGGEPVTTGETSVVTQDDDGFMFYTVSINGSSDIVQKLSPSSPSSIAGSRGTSLAFKIKASDILTDNQSYFDRFGFTVTINSIACKAIDTMVRVSGVKTGYSVDVPVRFVKDIS